MTKVEITPKKEVVENLLVSGEELERGSFYIAEACEVLRGRRLFLRGFNEVVAVGNGATSWPLTALFKNPVKIERLAITILE